MSPLLTGLPLLSGAEMLRAQYSLRLMSCSVAVRMSGTSGVICKAHKPALDAKWGEKGGGVESMTWSRLNACRTGVKPSVASVRFKTSVHKAAVEPAGQEGLFLLCYYTNVQYVSLILMHRWHMVEHFQLSVLPVRSKSHCNEILYT